MTSQIEADILKDQHAALDREISDWRTWWKELSELGQPNFGEMGDRLAQLRENLVAHFAIEESHGSPSRATRLREEHPELIAELEGLIARLHSCEGGFECWGGAVRRLRNFSIG